MAEKEYTMEQWALAYAKKGLAVFPVRAWGNTKEDFKSPLTAHGFNDATTDTNQINQWWSKYPTANIGIATGSKSGGLIAIDLDVDEEKGIDGREMLKNWEKEHAKLPDVTWLSITGRGGYHLFYKDSSIVRNRTGLLEGIDIRGEGGYIVAPPSLHFNGRHYEWEQSPDEFELMEAPAIIFDLLNPISENWDKQGYECPDEILDGSRTQTLVKTIASMKGKCFPDDTIKVTVRHLNETRCKPPLSDKELDSTVFPALKNLKEGTASYKAVFEIPFLESFLGFEGFEGADTAKLPLFDTCLLTPTLGRFSDAIIESLQVSSGMVAPAVVSVGALGIQKKYSAHPHSDWYEPSNLYMAIVADPSERKSPTMKEIMNPVFEYEREENDRIAPDIALYETKKKILEGRIASTTKTATSYKKNSDDKYLDMGDLITLQQELNDLEEVAPIRLVVDDITMEALAKVMEQNRERIGLFSTEGGIFNILAGRYSDKTVIDIVLKGYSGDRFAQDRQTRVGQTLYHPLITMLLYVQPIVIREIMENSEFVGRGLNARFLYSIPPSTIGKRKYKVRKISDFDRKDYSDVIKRLFSIPVPETPHAVEFSEDADGLAEKFFYEIEEKLKGSTPEFKAWLGKLHGTTMRIALVLHCFEYIEQSEYHKISGETMKNAIEMGKYFQAHAEAAFDIMGLMDPLEVRDAKYIMKRIDSMGQTEIKLRDLHDICRDRKGMEKKEGMFQGLICLIEHGYIRIQKSYPTPQNPQNLKKGGRPSEIVYVNPEYSKWKEQNK